MRAFFDTNIVIYSFVQNDGTKSDIARRTLQRWQDDGGAVISTQVLNETFYNAIRKHKFTREAARDVLVALCELPVVELTTDLVKKAADVAVETQLTIYDTLMIVAAGSAGCDRIFTEDLNHGQIVRGVRIVNPFREDTETT